MLTLAHIDKSTARVMSGRKAVGHLAMFAGSCYVNGASTYGFSFVAHVSTLDSGLNVFREAVAKAQ